jgi:hypothetical protein
LETKTMRRFIFAASATLATFTLAVLSAPLMSACGSDEENSSSSSSGGSSGSSGCVGFGCTDGSTTGPKPGCVGLECDIPNCEGSFTKTTLSGVVKDPAGKVPIFNAIVYVPQTEPEGIPTGATCDRCDAKVSGSPVVIANTNVKGEFKLEGVPVPAGGKLQLVVQIGKWRRIVTIDAPAKCADTPVNTGDGAGVFRLPKNRTEGNIPRIAIATGAADPIQCMFRKIGLEDGEFGVKGSESRVHLYEGAGFDTTKPTKNVGATAMTNAEALWGSAEELKAYDIVVLGCEGTENDTAQHKPATAKTALYDYAKAGGRVFTSHYHHTFFSTTTAPADTQGTGTWRTQVPETQPPAVGNPATTAVNASFPANPFPKAQAMKDWLQAQNALNPDGTVPIYDARHNIDSVTEGKALAWLNVANPNAGGANAVQYMSFNAPVGAPEDQICGRVVFSDLHVGGGPGTQDVATDAVAFPAGCVSTELSQQQKALEFMLFDLSSCVQKDDVGIQIPK